MGRLRIGLSISGAVALGAYEGGALAALLVAVQRLLEEPGPPVQVDAIAGSSAGSITGLLTARALLEGYDPVEVMRKSWVEADSLANLVKGAGRHSPLSTDQVQGMANELLSLKTKKAKQSVPIGVVMSIAALQGLRYPIPSLRPGAGRHRVEASTYLDWSHFTFHPGDGVELYTEPANVCSAIDIALASGANALGFPPKLLNRRRRAVRQVDEPVEQTKIVNIPEHGWLWYTDGGTINNEPLGRALVLVNDVDSGRAPWSGRRADEDRMVVIVNPHPTSGNMVSRWSTPDRQPGWTDTLLRAFDMQRSQSVFDEVREWEKANSRAVWAADMRATVRRLVDSLPAAERDRWAKEVGGLLQRIEDDVSEVHRLAAKPDGARAESKPAPAEADAAHAFDEALERVSGLAGVGPVNLQVVSPLLVKDELGATRVEEMLAGEFMFHFGGFLDQSLRESDFDLGYLTVQRWLEGIDGEAGAFTGPGQGVGLTPAQAGLAADAVAKCHTPKPHIEKPGEGRPLSWGAKAWAVVFGARVAGVTLYERLRRRDSPHTVPGGS